MLLGEADKWVPFSRQRTQNIEVTSRDVLVTLDGVVDESLNYRLYLVEKDVIEQVQCKIGKAGHAILSVQYKRCRSI